MGYNKTPEGRAVFAAYMRGWMSLRTPEQIETDHANKRRYYLENRDRLLSQSIEHGRKNRAQKQKYYTEWRKTEAGITSRNNAENKRRAIKHSCETFLTTSQVRQLRSSAKRCFYCSARFTKENRPTIDHVIPLNRGGAHSRENVVVACKKCNCSKCAQPPEQYARKLGLLLI